MAASTYTRRCRRQPAFVIDADDTGNALGAMFVGVIGDVNADGTLDIYASDWSNGAKGPSTGRVYVHSGKDGRRLLTLTGETAGEGFGTSLSHAGDVDGDGHDDLIVGAWQYAGAADLRRARVSPLGQGRAPDEDVHVPDAGRYIWLRRRVDGRYRQGRHRGFSHHVGVERREAFPFRTRVHRVQRDSPAIAVADLSGKFVMLATTARRRRLGHRHPDVESGSLSE